MEKVVFIDSAFANVPWDSNIDTINDIMENANFNHSYDEDDDCRWFFKGILPTPEIGHSRCSVVFYHEGTNRLINCELIVNFEEESFQAYFDFYLEILSAKYGEPKFLDKKNHEIIWYHVDDLDISNLSGKLFLKKEDEESIKISYYHPDYKNLFDNAISLRKDVIKRLI